MQDLPDGLGYRNVFKQLFCVRKLPELGKIPLERYPKFRLSDMPCRLPLDWGIIRMLRVLAGEVLEWR